MSRRWITWFRRVLYPVLGLMVPFGKAASRGLVQIMRLEVVEFLHSNAIDLGVPS